MPYQKKVDPWGNIHAVKSRGTFLGNRGVLHNDNQQIVASYRIKGWVTCLLEFKEKWLEANGHFQDILVQRWHII